MKYVLVATKQELNNAFITALLMCDFLGVSLRVRLAVNQFANTRITD